ncbi:RsmB/NOP family class I SAM-dependent RNA methyltransferase [Sulfolobus tengchongensis]|uniref:RsmB/NOP family class I SAM-dependent RNA methyltransferase n=1 Tax=Sulfolobus tengchongensis TaxID=207809 RepID=UPI0030D35E87
MSSVLYYVEERRYPLAVAFKRSLNLNRPRGVDSNLLFEYARQLLLSYYSLPQARRTVRIKYWLENKGNLNVSFPQWMEKKLGSLLDVNALKSSLKEKTVWIRVNLLKADIDKIIRELERYNVEFEIDKDLYYMIKVKEPQIRLSSLDIVKECRIIPQDKASSLVVEALRPQIKERLVELSSAPGIKASLYMMLTENKNEVFLADIDFNRISKEMILLKRCGVDMNKVHIVHQDSVRNSLIKADKVLLDAPCSSSGMINNDPSILITLNSCEKVDKFSKLQKTLLREAVNMKASDVVYSVCSLFPEEGEEIIDEYYEIAERPFDNYNYGYPNFRSSFKSNRVFPHIDFTEGFFISRLKLTRL